LLVGLGIEEFDANLILFKDLITFKKNKKKAVYNNRQLSIV